MSPSNASSMIRLMNNRFQKYMVENYGNDHGGGFYPKNKHKKHRCEPKIENEVKMMKPKRLLYLSFDGAAPIKKILLQRKRRIESYEKEINRLTSLVAKGLRGDVKHEAIENTKKNMLFHYELSPVTDLMAHLSARIKSDTENKRKSDDKNWIGLKVVLSDSDVPGEVEHKIMSFIKEYGYDQSHAIYSPGGNSHIVQPQSQGQGQLYLLQHIIDAYRGNSGEYLTEFDQVNYDNIFHFLRRLKKKEGELILSEKKKDVKDFRRRYYQEHDIDLQDLQAISDLAINYLKSWRCIWQMMITGSAPWKGLMIRNLPRSLYQ